MNLQRLQISFRALIMAFLFCAFVLQPDRAGASGPEEDTGSPFEIEAIALIATDFRFRGISYSDKKPVLQPELTIAHSSGIYVDIWGSNIAQYNGAHIEVDLSLGYETELGPVSIDAGITGSLYPGGTDTDFIELYSQAEAEVGPGAIQLQAYYAPVQANIGGEDNLYLGVAGRLPVSSTPIMLHGSFGIEDGAFGNAKRDWMIGASAKLFGFDVCLRYLDTARSGGDPNADATAVLLVSRTFVFPGRKVEHSGCPSW